LPCFTELYSIFYLNGVKVIPQNIYELLTPVALAHLIMGDGSVQRHGLIICTDSYTIPEVVRLLNVLMIRYGLDCTVRFHTSRQPRIYIRQRSMAKLQTIVGPYILPSFLYKIVGVPPIGTPTWPAAWKIQFKVVSLPSPEAKIKQVNLKHIN
jgi:hypothetical protein